MKDRVEILPSQRSRKRLNEKVVELVRRNFGNSVKACIEQLNSYFKGWIGFFGICTKPIVSFLRRVEAHIRRRLRALQLKQWKRKRTIVRKLVSMGANRRRAINTVYGKKRSIWNLSHRRTVERALSNQYWRECGLLSIEKLWRSRQIREVAPVQLTLNLV